MIRTALTTLALVGALASTAAAEPPQHIIESYPGQSLSRADANDAAVNRPATVRHGKIAAIRSDDTSSLRELFAGLKLDDVQLAATADTGRTVTGK